MIFVLLNPEFPIFQSFNFRSSESILEYEYHGLNGSKLNVTKGGRR